MMTLTVALVALVFGSLVGYGVGYQHGQERQWRQNPDELARATAWLTTQMDRKKRNPFGGSP